MRKKTKGTNAEEGAARDEALKRVERGNSQLVFIALPIARDMARKDGEVTSTALWRRLNDMAEHDENLRGLLDDADPRWMGAIFNRREWHRKGWRPEGSHKRPVSVWIRQPELAF